MESTWLRKPAYGHRVPMAHYFRHLQIETTELRDHNVHFQSDIASNISQSLIRCYARLQADCSGHARFKHNCASKPSSTVIPCPSDHLSFPIPKQNSKRHAYKQFAYTHTLSVSYTSPASQLFIVFRNSSKLYSSLYCVSSHSS